MRELRVIQCPYCGHVQPVLVERFEAVPEKIERCRECGGPMVVQSFIISETTIRITVRREER